MKRLFTDFTRSASPISTEVYMAALQSSIKESLAFLMKGETLCM